MRKFAAILSITAGFAFFACSTPQTTTQPKDQKEQKDLIAEENAKFLAAGPENSDELFRVVIMSDMYEVSQKGGLETIKRGDDKNGDKFICDELARSDKINEAREAVLTVSLYPDNGRINKIRPKRLAALREVDELIVEDIQRWNFVSPKKRSISPLKFDVRYRIVLRKKQSDEDIIKEVREKIKEKSSQ